MRSRDGQSAHGRKCEVSGRVEDVEVDRRSTDDEAARVKVFDRWTIGVGKLSRKEALDDRRLADFSSSEDHQTIPQFIRISHRGEQQPYPRDRYPTINLVAGISLFKSAHAVGKKSTAR